MNVTEVKPSGWAQFFDKVQEQARGATISLSAVSAEGAERQISASASLRRIDWDTDSDACNSRLRIEFGGSNDSTQRHEVLEPIRIKLRKDQAGGEGFRALEIFAESGTTILEFRPPLEAQVAEGLSLAE